LVGTTGVLANLSSAKSSACRHQTPRKSKKSRPVGEVRLGRDRFIPPREWQRNSKAYCTFPDRWAAQYAALLRPTILVQTPGHGKLKWVGNGINEQACAIIEFNYHFSSPMTSHHLYGLASKQIRESCGFILVDLPSDSYMRFRIFL
jgi:hypothetical protein